MSTSTLPLAIRPAPEAVDPEIEPLLDDAFASAWAAAGPTASTKTALRDRLAGRLQASRAASDALHTVRVQRLPATELAPGVAARLLYAAPQDRPLRPGEPLRARLVELQPGARWAGPDATAQREWLVLRGSVRIGDEALSLRDFHVVPAGAGSPAVESDSGALLFLREAALPAGDDGAVTVRDDSAGWPEFGPGIRRRVLWQRDGQAAMLYLTEPGATVPTHSHGHDEECLMVQGDIFLDDVLLQEGDYQLAPAGTLHHLTETDTGVVLYAHGDLDLNFEG